VAAYEVLFATHAVRNLIREGKTRQLRNVVSTHQSEGMQTLEMALTHLVQVGVIDYETALKVSLFPKEVGKPGPAWSRRPGRPSAAPPPPPPPRPVPADRAAGQLRLTV